MHRPPYKGRGGRLGFTSDVDIAWRSLKWILISFLFKHVIHRWRGSFSKNELSIDSLAKVGESFKAKSSIGGLAKAKG